MLPGWSQEAIGNDRPRWMVTALRKGGTESGLYTVPVTSPSTFVPVPDAPPTSDAETSARLDVWLDVSCIFATRTAAGRAIRGGKVSVNGETAKPNKTVRPGDRIEVRWPGRRRILVVRGVTDRHIPRAEARGLYEDMTPPPTPEEATMRRALRRDSGAGRPSSRERRLLAKVRGH